MVLAMAGMASAAVTLGGSFKVEYVIDTDNDNDAEAAGKGTPDVPVTLSVDAADEGVWDLNLNLNADAEGDGEVSVGDWTFNLYDEWFNVELWGGGVEKGQLATPLKFVATDDPAEVADTARMRLSSDVAGLFDVTIDYEPVRLDVDADTPKSDVLYVFASKAMDDLTVGGAIKTDLHADTGVLADGHVKYVFGPATLTGEVAMDTAHDEDNLAIGGSVSYKLTDKVTLRGKATRKAENIGDELLLEAGADYEESLFKVSGTVTRKKDDIDDSATDAANTLKASVTYRSNDDVAYDDLFDKYTTLTGYAAFAEAAYTTAKDTLDDKEALTKLTLKGAGVAVPGMVWVYGDFIYAADKDTVQDEDFELIVANNKLSGDVEMVAENYMRLNAEATVKVTDKLDVVPSVAYATWSEATLTKTADFTGRWDWTGGVTPKTASGLELGAAATYALSDDAKVGVSYTSRTQTFKDLIPEELKDSFVKVYFSTSF
jgi:hypothetical protein